MITSRCTAERKEAVDSISVSTLIKGTVEVDRDHVIHFSKPLIGYDVTGGFVLLQTQEGPLYWLQSIEDVNLCFCLLAPFQIGLDPDMPVGQQELELIDASGVDDVDVYTVVILDEDPDRIRTNLRAPVLVSRSSNKAVQVILDNQDLPIQFFLKKDLSG